MHIHNQGQRKADLDCIIRVRQNMDKQKGVSRLIEALKMCVNVKEFESIAEKVAERRKDIQVIEKRLCPDCYVAKIEIDMNNNNGHIKYVENSIKNTSERESLNDKLKNEDYPIIAIVLESPHIDEFKDGISPLKNGFSSTQLFNYLPRILFNYIATTSNQGNIFSRATHDIENGIYRVKLINAVQFQCSLGRKLSNKEYQKMKNDIVAKCLKNKRLKRDFFNRLNGAKIIINCCTGQEKGKIAGLQKLVQNIIDKKYSDKTRLYGYHPSSFHFLKGFKKV